MVVSFDELYKRYLGIFEILKFLPVLGARKLKKWAFSVKKSIFRPFRLKKWAKNSKSQKIPSNVCKTHKMGPLCQKLGSKSDLEPKE